MSGDTTEVDRVLPPPPLRPRRSSAHNVHTAPTAVCEVQVADTCEQVVSSAARPTRLGRPPGVPRVATTDPGPSPRPSDASAVSVSPSPSPGHAPAAVADKPPQLAEPARALAHWSAERARRRPLPRSLRIAAGAVVGILALVVIGGSRDDPDFAAGGTSHLPAAVVAHEEDLVNRKELTAADFAPRAPQPRRIAVKPEPSADELLDERRRRREDNPEDLKARPRSHRPRATRSSRTGRTVTPASAGGPQIIVDLVDGDAEPAASAASDTPTHLVAAGARVHATLASHVVVRGRSANVVLRVGRGQALPRGTRLLGRARAADDGVVLVRVHTLVLPGGAEHRVEAEVQDTDGAAGVVALVSGGGNDDDGSVAGDVAEGTLGRTGSALLGDGLAGGAFDDATRSRRRRARRPRRAPPTFTVAKGTPVVVFFESSVDNRRR